MKRSWLLIAAVSGPLFAQDVARVGETKGKVSLASGTQLAAGQLIRTGWNAWAELLLDPEHTIRLRGETEVHVVRVEQGKYRFSLTKGALVNTVTGRSATEVRIDTPNVYMVPSMEGVYEFSVRGSDRSEIVAELGSVAVFAPQGHEWVSAGQKMVVRGDASNPQFKIGSALTLRKRLAIALAPLRIGGGGGGGVGVAVGSDDSSPAESASSKPEAKAPAGESLHHATPVQPPAAKTEQPSVRGKS